LAVAEQAPAAYGRPRALQGGLSLSQCRRGEPQAIRQIETQIAHQAGSHARMVFL